jgi:hypothetical protein
MNPEVREALHRRLRRPPGRFSVPGSLPVLFFGDILTAQVATVGINPSDQEYLSPSGSELDGALRRFQTLKSLGCVDRASLTPEQCERAIRTMQGYFQPGKPVYKWFQPLDRVLRGMGFHYERGEAVHLDLAQEATRPTWSELKKASPPDAEAMLRADDSFLCWQLEAFPVQAVVCNGRTPLDAVQQLLGAKILHRGNLARLNWSVGIASLGRPIAVAGWNLPLGRAGLVVQDEIELGRILMAHVRRCLNQ